MYKTRRKTNFFYEEEEEKKTRDSLKTNNFEFRQSNETCHVSNKWHGEAFFFKEVSWMLFVFRPLNNNGYTRIEFQCWNWIILGALFRIIFVFSFCFCFCAFAMDVNDERVYYSRKYCSDNINTVAAVFIYFIFCFSRFVLEYILLQVYHLWISN